MEYLLIVLDGATLSVTQVIRSPIPVVVFGSDGRLYQLPTAGTTVSNLIVMPGKGIRRLVVSANNPSSSAASGQVQVNNQLIKATKREAINGSAVFQNGSKISDFFKSSRAEVANVSRTSVTTPVKVNGVKSLPTPKGSAKKHIIQVPTDVVDDVLENGIGDKVPSRRHSTRRKVPFASTTVKEEPAQLSSVKSERVTKIIPRENGDRSKLTGYFPIRRSNRLTRSRLIKRQHSEVEEALINGIEDGLKVEQILGKGRGVVAAKNFRRGEFVVEYAGELISMSQARQREVHYAQDQNKGCYMYYFLHNNRRYCVDATEESGRVGRLVNHSRSNGNLVTKTFVVGEQPHLILVAKRDIARGDELLYDYGDRSKMSLEAHPWLAT